MMKKFIFIFCFYLLVINCLASSKVSSSEEDTRNPLIKEVETDIDLVCNWIQDNYVRNHLPEDCEDPKSGCKDISSSSSAKCTPGYYSPITVPGCGPDAAFVDKSSTSIMYIKDWRSRKWDEILCRMDGLGKELISVGKKAKNVTHVFAGFPGGALRIWPAVDWSQPDPNNTNKTVCPGYDPRETSWYSLASTGPLDVVLVLDVTKKMCDKNRINKAAEAIRALLHMFATGVSYMNIVMFNETSTFLLPAAQERLVDGKPVLLEISADMAELLRSQLLDVKPDCDAEIPSKYSYTDSPTFLKAIGEAENILSYSREISIKKEPHSSFCRRAIVVLSANSAPEVKISMAETSDLGNSSENGVSLFAFTYGSDETVIQYQKELTCNNSGLHSLMYDNDTSHVNEIFKITQYFAAGMLESQSVWTLSGEDMLPNTTIVSRSCRWLISTPPKLLSVVAVAVPTARVKESLSPEEIEELLEVSTCSTFELNEYGVEELRGQDRCNSSVDLTLILLSIIVGFFVIALTSVGISLTMLPAKTLKKYFPWCVSDEKNVLEM